MRSEKKYFSVGDNMEKMTFSAINRFYNSFAKTITNQPRFVTDEVASEFREVYMKKLQRSELSDSAYREYIYSKISDIELDKSQIALAYEINFTPKALAKMKGCNLTSKMKNLGLYEKRRKKTKKSVKRVEIGGKLAEKR